MKKLEDIIEDTMVYINAIINTRQENARLY